MKEKEPSLQDNMNLQRAGTVEERKNEKYVTHTYYFYGYVVKMTAHRSVTCGQEFCPSSWSYYVKTSGMNGHILHLGWCNGYSGGWEGLHAYAEELYREGISKEGY